jgi:hypothetical protein
VDPSVTLDQATTPEAATRANMTDDIRKDLIVSWFDHVAGQSSDLWAVALPLLVAQALIIATLHSDSCHSKTLFFVMYISAFSSVVSLFFGYTVKGAVIEGAAEVLRTGRLDIPPYPSVSALCQFVSLGLALLSFVGAFAFFRKEVSRALHGLFRGE